MKFKVTMVCQEIWKAEAVVDHESNDLEAVKDKAWSVFDVIKKNDLEQENYTKVEELT